jgi:hypothetical protein
LQYRARPRIEADIAAMQPRSTSAAASTFGRYYLPEEVIEPGRDHYRGWRWPSAEADLTQAT